MSELATPRSLTEAIRDNPHRFVDNAFRENPDINDLISFKDALFRAFNTDRGNNASAFFNDKETMDLFTSDACKDRLKDNIPEAEFSELFREIKRGEWEVEREIPKGEKIKPSQARVIYSEKKIAKPQYFRHGKPVRAYSSGYRRWQTAEIKFIKVRKEKGVMPKIIVAEYNKHFRNNPRSLSSIRTKSRRLGTYKN